MRVYDAGDGEPIPFNAQDIERVLTQKIYGFVIAETPSLMLGIEHGHNEHDTYNLYSKAYEKGLALTSWNRVHTYASAPEAVIKFIEMVHNHQTLHGPNRPPQDAFL